MTTEILIIFVPLIEIYQWEAGNILEQLGLEPEPGEDAVVTSLRNYMFVVYYWILVIKGIVIHRIVFANRDLSLNTLITITFICPQIFDECSKEN